MIIADNFLAALNSPSRTIRARVEVINGATLEQICGCANYIKGLKIERIGDTGKFFGFGICQKALVHFVDKDRALDISKENAFDIAFGVGADYIHPYPAFYVERVSRDENTNALTVTAYDALYRAAEHTVAELSLPASYTIKQFAEACASLLGVPVNAAGLSLPAFDTLYPAGANFGGEETVRQALDAVAEATQTVYYINADWQLTFKRLDKDGAAVLTLDREKYFTATSGDNKRLGTICSATELGDNVSASIAQSGSTQYVRDNPFWTLRDDIGTLVGNAIDAVGGLTINQFETEWRGNFLLEVGDKIAIVTKDGKTAHSYVLDDVLTFTGALTESTQWKYAADETESESNPATLGDALKQTFARVDKANQQIDILAQESAANSSDIAALLINTESINASVKSTEEATKEALDSANNAIETLTQEVAAKIDAESVAIEVRREIDNGVEKVQTATGYTFGEDGLDITKSGSDISTRITEDGMRVSKDGDVVLKADNEGVKAEDLHATTYLLIGANSRFENYGAHRTGCFWIGG